jgi:hypothetical protein
MRILNTWKGWRATLRKECPSVVFEGDRADCRAFGFWLGVKKPVGHWDGEKGTIEYPRGNHASNEEQKLMDIKTTFETIRSQA